MKSEYVELMAHWKRAMTMNNKEEASRLKNEADQLILEGKVTEREITTAKYVSWR